MAPEHSRIALILKNVGGIDDMFVNLGLILLVIRNLSYSPIVLGDENTDLIKISGRWTMSRY